MSHTPGPWTVQPMDNVDDEEAAKPFAYVFGPDDRDPWVPPAEWRFKVDDARLIAAAPDLLAALELMAKVAEEQDLLMPLHEQKQIQAAIAKASDET